VVAPLEAASSKNDDQARDADRGQWGFFETVCFDSEKLAASLESNLSDRRSTKTMFTQPLNPRRNDNLAQTAIIRQKREPIRCNEKVFRDWKCPLRLADFFQPALPIERIQE
jgi:hypothetical protein